MIRFDQWIAVQLLAQNIKELKKLIEENRNYKLDFDMQSPFADACYLGNMEIIEYLLTYEEVRYTGQDVTLIEFVSLNGNLNVIKLLFKKYSISLSFEAVVRIVTQKLSGNNYKSALYIYERSPYKTDIKRLVPHKVRELLQINKINSF